MSWFSKKLKKVTKVLDPIGDRLRKSTGGSYGDPMNWYNSKPNQTIPYQQRVSQGLMVAPNGQNTLPGMTFGGNTGGRTYIPNQFSSGMMMGGVQPPAPMAPPPNIPSPMQPPQQQAQLAQGPMQQQMMRIGAIRGNYV